MTEFNSFQRRNSHCPSNQNLPEVNNLLFQNPNFPTNEKDRFLLSDHNYSSVNNFQINSRPDKDSPPANDEDKEKTCDWQTVSNKRGMNSSNYQNVKKPCPTKAMFVLEKRNSYEPLKDMDDMDDNNVKTPTAEEPKPPPIFIYDVTNIKNMTKVIESVIPKQEYTFKCLNQNKIKISPVTINSYRKLLQRLIELKVNFHTYQLKKEKPYRVVLKNMHFSTDLNEIKNAIENEGFKIRSVINVKQYKTKYPLSMFFVDLEPSPVNKNIYNIKFLLNAAVTFEALRKRQEIVQCKKCQSYGHTKSYCWHPYRCVKCGQQHDTRECTKPVSDSPKCALCEGEHPANYKGCTVYRNLKAKSFPSLITKVDITRNTTNFNQTKQESSTNSYMKSVVLPSPRTYAQAAASKSAVCEEVLDNNSVSQVLKSFFDKFEKIMLQQVQQINSLVNLLATVISKIE